MKAVLEETPKIPPPIRRFGQLPIIYREVEDIVTRPERYDVQPPYQRQTVWNRRMKQQLADSILRSYPIGTLSGFKQPKSMLEILNGHQRIACLQEFYNSRFRTMTIAEWKNYEPRSDIEPIEPGKFFHELSEQAQEWFLTYPVPIEILPENMSEMEKAIHYERVQNQESLRPAERDRIFPSRARTVADHIAEHPFWTLYQGETRRGQLYRAGLWLLALEMNGPFVDLTTAFMKRLAGGKFDNKITDHLIDAIDIRLTVTQGLYTGLRFTSSTAAIPMYQSVMMVERTGYAVRQSDSNKLTGWIRSLIGFSNQSLGVPAFNRPIPMLLLKEKQEAFWKREEKIVLVLLEIQKPAT